MTGILMTRKTKLLPPTITLTNMTMTLTIEHDYKHLHHYDQGDHHHLHQDDLADFLALLFNPIYPGLFWYIRYQGGAHCAPPKYLWVGEG